VRETVGNSTVYYYTYNQLYPGSMKLYENTSSQTTPPKKDHCNTPPHVFIKNEKTGEIIRREQQVSLYQQNRIKQTLRTEGQKNLFSQHGYRVGSKGQGTSV
jgi:hypothetical protein